MLRRFSGRCGRSYHVAPTTVRIVSCAPGVGAAVTCDGNGESKKRACAATTVAVFNMWLNYVFLSAYYTSSTAVRSTKLKRAYTAKS